MPSLHALFQLLVKLAEVDSNLEDSEGNTPAHLAAAEGHLDCLRLLVYHKKEPMDVVIARNNNVKLQETRETISFINDVTYPGFYSQRPCNSVS